MPLYNPPLGGISLDVDGFVVIEGSTIPPWKIVIDTNPETGVIHFALVAKHPTLGEVDIAFNDRPSA
jgi:hypothetical protein